MLFAASSVASFPPPVFDRLAVCKNWFRCGELLKPPSQFQCSSSSVGEPWNEANIYSRLSRDLQIKQQFCSGTRSTNSFTFNWDELTVEIGVYLFSLVKATHCLE